MSKPFTAMTFACLMLLASCSKPTEKIGFAHQIPYANAQAGVTQNRFDKQQFAFAATIGRTRSDSNPPNAPGEKSPNSGAIGSPEVSSHE